MNIAILGGSFNPPHIGHALVAMQVKELLPVDEVWLMPACRHPFNKEILPAEHRLAMSRFLENEYIKVSDFEIIKRGISYTVDTLNGLKSKYPHDNFYWISGEEQILEYKKWKDWERFIREYNLIIFPRPLLTESSEKLLKKEFGFISIPENIIIINNGNLIITNISSTMIRERIKGEKSIRNLVPEKVGEYIREHGLYK